LPVERGRLALEPPMSGFRGRADLDTNFQYMVAALIIGMHGAHRPHISAKSVKFGIGGCGPPI
jgi:hypothetical protein